MQVAYYGGGTASGGVFRWLTETAGGWPGHGGEIAEGIESAGGVSYHRRWWSFQVKPSRRFVCDFVIQC